MLRIACIVWLDEAVSFELNFGIEYSYARDSGLALALLLDDAFG